jgi:5-methylcytosine-specific restriction endonuclease McrA
VFQRDKGVCAGCAADTEKIARVAYHTKDDIWSIYRAMGFNRNRHQTLWEADHMVEVSNDGETSLDNIQTLCVPCHKAKTKKMHADRKAARTGIKPRAPVREVQLRMIG